MKPIEHQFRQLAFAQVLTGMLAFCLAEGRPILLGIVGTLAVASWFLTEGQKQIGLDRNLLNLGAVGAVVLLIFEVTLSGGIRPVALVGHFTLALQLVLLFAIKTRREYIQLALLSPLQIIAASVLPGGVSLLFGILLLTYCFITLLTVLSFQLKSAGDLVHQRYVRGAAHTNPPERPDQVSGPHHRLHFRASALVIALCCGTLATLVFLVMPRSQQDPFAAALVSSASSQHSQAGFNHRVKLGEGAIGGGSQEPVLNVAISQADMNLGRVDKGWLIRGAVQDTYDPRNRVWSRIPQAIAQDLTLELPDHGLRLAIDQGPTYEAAITLRRKSVRNLFTVVSTGGPVAPVYLDAPMLERVGFSTTDQQLVSGESLATVLRYRVSWAWSPYTDLRTSYRDRLGDLDLRQRRNGKRPQPNTDAFSSDRPDPTLEWPVQIERVRALAERLLRARGMPTDYADATAEQRMQAGRVLAEHLRRGYRYSLDIPNIPDTDPVIAFLFKTRAGHCELFASGLAAMCRSVGIPARLATGYRASEYNGIGEYYVVRESHAHAWTEIDLGPGGGWHVLDATPAVDSAAQAQANAGLLGQMRALYDHLEFNWIATVITYDQDTQQELLGAFGSVLNQAPDRWVAGSVEWISEKAEQVAFDTVGRALGIVILIALIVAVLSLVRLLVLRHQRMVALQLTALPRAQQRLLAKQLRFYISMLEMLERHGRTREHWQSPFQFARALAEEQPLRFEPVIPLTELFYEVRFGYRQLDSDRLGRIRLHLRRLEQNLATTA